MASETEARVVSFYEDSEIAAATARFHEALAGLIEDHDGCLGE
jgi:hypothetical protein